MNFPQKISFADKSPKGSTITGHIDGQDLPFAIQIKGTNDVSPVQVEYKKAATLVGSGGGNNHEDCDDHDHDRGHDNHCDPKDISGGSWNSCRRYTTLKQTLQLLDKNRHVVLECNYDTAGNIVVQKPSATLSDSSIALDDSNPALVDFTWTSATEVLVKSYESEKKLSTDTTWTSFKSDRPLGAGSNYASTDVPGVVGDVNYRLRVVFNDNTDNVLVSNVVNLPAATPPAPDVTITFNPFLSSPTSGFVHIEFSSITESGVAAYAIYRKGPSDTAYSKIIDITPTGAGSTYPNDDFAGAGNGTFLYQLTATFNDTTFPEKVLLTDQSITV